MSGGDEIPCYIKVYRETKFWDECLWKPLKNKYKVWFELIYKYITPIFQLSYKLCKNKIQIFVKILKRSPQFTLSILTFHLCYYILIRNLSRSVWLLLHKYDIKGIIFQDRSRTNNSIICQFKTFQFDSI